MTFRQQGGPAASTRQVQRLQVLLGDAGYGDFRSARGPLGLTQRQGLGKFTDEEAASLIEQLEADAELPSDDVVPAPRPKTVSRPLRDTSTDALVAELQLRGWDASKR